MPKARIRLSEADRKSPIADKLVQCVMSKNKSQYMI